MSHKFFKTGYPYANQRTRKSKKEEMDYGDDVPLISQRGYAISLADAAVKVKKAQKALDEARKKMCAVDDGTEVWYGDIFDLQAICREGQRSI